MQCDEFKSRLQSVLDERARPDDDPTLQAHAAYCDCCELLMQSQRRLFFSLRTRNEGEPDKVFSARVVDEAQRGTLLQSPWTLIPAGFVALAASWLVFFMWPQVSTQNPQSISSVAILTETHRPPLGVLKRDQPNEPRVAITPADESSMPRDLFEILVTFSETQFEELESVDKIAGGFRPIAASLNVAFDALRRTFPGSGPRQERS
jgi:hypothetical protein